MYLTGELDYMIDYYCKTSIQLNMIWKADRVGYANHAIFEDGAHCGGSPTPPAFAHFDGESKQRLMPFAAKRIGLEQSCPDALEDSDWLIVSPENYADAIKNRGR